VQERVRNALKKKPRMGLGPKRDTNGGAHTDAAGRSKVWTDTGREDAVGGL
jgi:hypothetical protein